MTIASLVVDIAAQTASLEKSVGTVHKQLESVAERADKVGKALVAAFSVSAVAGFAQDFLEFSGNLMDLSAQTGITAEGIQRLGIAFDAVPFETVAANVSRLSKAIIGGDGAAVGAIGKLGVSLSNLKTMAPEQQFVEVADAISRLENPTERAYAAMTIFGKGGADLLKNLDSPLKDTIANINGMEVASNALVARADALSKKLESMGRWIRGVLGSVLLEVIDNVSAAFDGLWLGITKMLSGLAGLAQRVPVVGKYLTGLGDAQKWLDEQSAASAARLRDWVTGAANVSAAAATAAPKLVGLGEASKVAGTAAKAHGDELVRLRDRIDQINASVSAGIYNRSGDMGAGAVDAEIARAKAMSDALQKAATLDDVSSRSRLGALVSRPLEDAIGPSFAQRFAARLPNVIQSAFQGGGNVLKSIGSAFGGDLGKAIVGTGANGLGGFLTGALGKTFGGALSAMIPGLGSLLGGLGTKLIGKIFSNPEKQINPIRQAFIDAGGGLAAMNQKAAEAGVTMRAVLDAKTPEAYKKAIDDLNAAFEFQDNAMKTLDETVKRYGFTIDELGPAMQRQALDKQAQQLYQDFQVLTAAGLNVDTVLGKMGGSIQDFVTQSLRTGTEIPIAMQPMLQKMVELGQLTDANGNIITNLEDSGVSFAMTMSQGFQELMKSVDKLTQAIARGLGVALDNLPTETNLDVNINYNENNRPGGIADPLRDINLTPMADGGIGRVTRPTLFLAGEAGAEDFAFSGGGRSFRSGGGGSVASFGEMKSELSQVREQQTRLNDYMTGLFARDLARATRDEVQKVAWRKRY